MLICFFCLPASLSAQWVIQSPFEQKVFIKNHGQFDERKGDMGTVLFGMNNLGTQIYFTKKGLFYRFDVQERMPRGTRAPGEMKAEEHRELITRSHFLSMEWFDANPGVEVLASEPVADYYNFSLGPAKESIDRVAAYQKLLYRNLYKGIDVEYTFHAKEGIKYTLVVHPGADPGKVAMLYKHARTISEDAEQNIHFVTEAGDIVDHAPYSFYQDTKEAVQCSFMRVGDLVRFKIDKYDKKRTLVIDPWVTSPAFPNLNKAYDIAKDGAGNIYAFGGQNPYLLKKYSSAGVLLWTYTTAFVGWYGDLAVEPGGTCYITEGYSSGNSFTSIARISPAGSQVWLATVAGKEYWTLAFNCDFSVLSVGGGVSTGNLANIDVTSGNAVSSTVVNASEPRALTQGATGNFYFLTHVNSQLAAVTSAFAPVWTVPSGYSIPYSIPAYNTSYVTTDGGFNGVATKGSFVCTTNGSTLSKHNISNGVSTATASIPGGMNLMNAGVYIDNCGNVYAGSQSSIVQYDSNLNVLSTIAAPGAVYCVTDGVGTGDILACGNGFIASLAASIPVCNSAGFSHTLTVTAPDCFNNTTGSATVAVSGGTSPYSVVWGTTPPQTGTVAVNIPPGTYTVSITDNSCAYAIIVDTFVVPPVSGGFTLNSQVQHVACNGQNTGSISLQVSGGVPPYLFTWAGGSSGIGLDSMGNLPAGTYTIQISDSSGCSGSVSLNISEPPALSYTATAIPKCVGDTTSITINVSGGNSPYVMNWTSPAPFSGFTIHGVTGGVFSGTIIDSNSCSVPFTYTMTQSPPISASSTADVNCAIAGSGTIHVSAAGGVLPYTFNWTGYPGFSQDSLTGLSPGVYTVTVVDSNGCSVVLLDSVPVFAPLSLTLTATQPCNGGSDGTVMSTVSGGVAGTPYQYTWSGSTVTTGTLTNIPPGTYSLTVTSAGCIGSAALTVAQQPIVDSLQLSTRYCLGDDNALIKTADDPAVQPPYQWYDSTQVINGATAPAYSAPVSNLDAYWVTWYYNGCRYQSSQLIVELVTNIFATEPANIFTPNGDGKNEIFFPFATTSATLAQNPASYSLVIFNRWGKKVFESTSISLGWDGRLPGGRPADDGVYYWIMEAKTDCAKNYAGTMKGFVQLQR